MRLSVTDRHPRDVAADAVAQVFVPPLGEVSIGRHLSAAARSFVVPDGGALTWVEPRRMKAARAVMASMGRGEDWRARSGWNGGAAAHEHRNAKEHALRALGGAIERGCFAQDIEHLVLAPTPEDLDPMLIVEGMLLRSHGSTEFREGEIATTLRRVTLCVHDRRAVQQRLAQTVHLVDATNYARALGDLPANVGTAAEIVARVRRSAADVGLAVEVLGARKLEQLGMGLLLGVARGAATPPVVLLLHHRPRGVSTSPIVFIGKGLTHDTGGYNLKPAAGLSELIYDKCGGMAVIGAMHAIARLGLPRAVIGVVPLVENCIDAAAYKPGDILRAMDGTTVHIENTDAEGRLVLADCLTYVRRYRPSMVVDIGTLTGACSVALGEPFAGLFSNDDGLRDVMIEAGWQSDDLLWPLPIHPIHRASIVHHKAQIRNTGVRAGGACAAAAFLRHFVRYRWAHVDIAGKASWNSERPYLGRGATGFGTRLLVRVAQLWSSETTVPSAPAHSPRVRVGKPSMRSTKGTRR